MVDIQWGYDISSHQALGVSPQRALADGFSFMFTKATQGDWYTSPYFRQQYDGAVAAGLITVPYVFLESSSSAEAQAAYAHSVLPAGCPVVPDCESTTTSAVSLATTVEWVRRMRDLGHAVPIAYIPSWYWAGNWGSPDLSALGCLLWASRYPDNNGTFAAEIYSRVPDSYWNSYGGVPVKVLQFTSSATVAGYSPVDANAYEGTKDELRAFLLDEPAAPMQQKFFLTNG